MPDNIVTPSAKMAVFMRGTFKAGTTGIGYVSANLSAPANDSGMIQTTTATSVMTTTTAISAATNTTYNNCTLPWARADFAGNELKWRVVAAGLRACYEGTELDRSGHLTGYHEPSNGNIVADHNLLLNFPQADFQPNKRQWVEALWSPTSGDDLSYSNSNGGSNHPLIVVVGGHAAGESFRYELVVYYEFTGELVTNMGHSKSHSDPQGMGAVQQVVQDPKALIKIRKNRGHRGILDEVAKVVGDVSQVVSGIVKTGEQLAPWITPFFGKGGMIIP